MYIKLSAYKNNDFIEFYYNSTKKTFTENEPTNVRKSCLNDDNRKRKIIKQSNQFLKQKKLILNSLEILKKEFTKNNCIQEKLIKKIA